MVFHCEILCIMWQLRFSMFLKSVFSIALEIRCLLVRSYYVRKYDTVTLRVGSSFLDSFFVVRLHKVLKIIFRLLLWRTFITLELRYLFVQKVTFFDDVRITLNYGNCWNLWIVYGSYVIKWSHFTCIIFVAHQLW